MANRRMFSKDVVETDKFLNMPLTSQALYFHLGMEADDDGFVASPKKVQRSIGCSEGDLQILASRGFIIPFESGIVVLVHWKQNNYIQADRYRKTVHKEEAALLQNDNYVYSLVPTCIHPVSSLDPQDSIGKDRVGKDSIELDKDNIDKDNIYVCSELSPVSKMDTEKTEPEKVETVEVEPVPSGYKIILLDKSFYEIPLEKLNFWKESYPAVDVEQEIRNMEAWADANPTRRKTRNGVVRFITNWLKREQNKGGSYQRGNSRQKASYDLDSYLQQRINGGNANDNTGTGFTDYSAF